MNLKNKILIGLGLILLFFFVMFLCQKEVDLNNFTYKEVIWDSLPIEIQNEFLNNSEQMVVNFDSEFYNVEYKNTSIVGIYKGKNKFIASDLST